MQAAISRVKVVDFVPLSSLNNDCENTTMNVKDKDAAPYQSEGRQESDSVSRRSFLGGTSGLAAMSLIGAPALSGLMSTEATAEVMNPTNPNRRRSEAFRIRNQAALIQKASSQAKHSTNTDEQLYSGFIANYSKGLPHNHLGEVDTAAYTAFTNALASGNPADYETIPMGGMVKLANPQAGQAYQLEGADSHNLAIPMFTPFDSEALAGEMAEVYWNALMRDVPFSQYGSDSLAEAAIADLDAFSNFSGVNAGNLFRGSTPGEAVGPLLSQFLWLEIPYGQMKIGQKYNSPIFGQSFMTNYYEWLDIQNGVKATSPLLVSGQGYIRNIHDLADWVHSDFSYQGFLNAALILMGMGAQRDTHPYSSSVTQGAFITFGGPHILEMVAKAAYAGLKAAWFQKWQVHRALRPEVLAGRVHNHMTGAAQYPIHGSLLDSGAVARIYSANSTYLLPMAYPEGSPTHPSYPAGHAAIAGACVTMLKAFFNESYVIPAPVVATDDGQFLDSYSDDALTVGGELNKLASNISLGRDYAGVHYRQDGVYGMQLGEQVAINLLSESKALFNESGVSFTLTKFDGTSITF